MRNLTEDILLAHWNAFLVDFPSNVDFEKNDLIGAFSK